MSSVWFLGIMGFFLLVIGACGTVIRLSVASMSYIASASLRNMHYRAGCEESLAKFKKTPYENQPHFEESLCIDKKSIVISIDFKGNDIFWGRVLCENGCLYQGLLR